MELFSAEFFSALLAIIVIDIVLAGDNALVIAMASRNLPKELQRKAIIWGTFGAIAIRSVSTLAVVWLLQIPFLMLAGGTLLLYIAYKLLVEEKDHTKLSSSNNIYSAIKVIIVADVVMGVDNVLAVAGAAHGSFLLVVIGLLISIPLVVWGSTLIIKWIERFPSIIYIGSGVIAFTAAKMITAEQKVGAFFAENPLLKYGFIFICVVAVLGLGRLTKQRSAKTQTRAA